MDRTKPTTQMLGRFQPWHKGHTELFRRGLAKTSQVIILLRSTPRDQDNPYTFKERCAAIHTALDREGFDNGIDYEIMEVPNITHITYGRDVGYTIEQEKFGEEIETISSTRLRND